MAARTVRGWLLTGAVLAADQMYDVDLTVEEAVQSVVTSGISVEAIDRNFDRPLATNESGDMAADPVEDGLDGVDGDPREE